MLLQAAKTYCVGEYISPNISNAECMDTIQHIAEVRKIYFFRCWIEGKRNISFTAALFFVWKKLTSMCELAVHFKSMRCPNFGTKVQLCITKTNGLKMGTQIFWWHSHRHCSLFAARPWKLVPSKSLSISRPLISVHNKIKVLAIHQILALLNETLISKLILYFFAEFKLCALLHLGKWWRCAACSSHSKRK